MKTFSPVIALAFAEDALAIASWASAQGYQQDAEAMREFAARVRAAIPPTNRWASKGKAS